MSYRELEAALCGIASYGTLCTWIKKDFPKVAQQMAGGNLSPNGPQRTRSLPAGAVCKGGKQRFRNRQFPGVAVKF